MPKPMYVWSGSAWVSVASEVESLATYATQSYADAQPGMKMVVPTSVAVGSGSGSVATQGTVTFSGASSVSLNGCFSATYESYYIVFDITTATATSGLQMRVRVSGADNTSSNYRYNSLTVADNVGTIGVSRSNGTNTLFDDIGRLDNGYGASGFINFFSPFTSNRTRIVGQSSGNDSVPANCLRSYTGNMTVTTSYTGFTLFAASGNITGTIGVYGYRD